MPWRTVNSNFLYRFWDSNSQFTKELETKYVPVYLKAEMAAQIFQDTEKG